MGKPFKLGEGELALLRRLHMLEREELGKASRCFSLGTLLACGDLEGETRVSLRCMCEERWQGRLKAVSIVCRLGIDIPGIPEAAEAGEASSMNSRAVQKTIFSKNQYFQVILLITHKSKTIGTIAAAS